MNWKLQNFWIRITQQESFPTEYIALMEKADIPSVSKIARYNPFLEDGLIQLCGLHEYAEILLEQKHPLLLYRFHRFTELLTQKTHTKLHHLRVRIVLSELRSQFWILRAPQSIKNVLHTHLPCNITRNH